MKSYFFIPANNANYLAKVQSIEADEIILELEDGIPDKDINLAFTNIQKLGDYHKFWVRPNMSIQINGQGLAQILFTLGFRKFIIPKVTSIQELLPISDLINHPDSKIVLLVETTQLLIQLNEVVNQFPFYGLGFGLHDFAKCFDTFTDYKMFKPFINQVLLVAKANQLQYIDSPSMELNEANKESFLSELSYITAMGGDGKFIVHPRQLDWFNEANLYSEEQIKWALKITQIIAEDPETIENFNTLVIENQIIEKAHLTLVHKIVNWYEKHK